MAALSVQNSKGAPNQTKPAAAARLSSRSLNRKLAATPPTSTKVPKP